MSRQDTPGHLSEILIRRFSDRGLRQAVARQFPDLTAYLPGDGASLRQLADALVQLAERRGCLADVAVRVLPEADRRPRCIGRMLLCALATGSAALATGVAMYPSAEADPTTEIPPLRAPDEPARAQPVSTPDLAQVLPAPISTLQPKPPRTRRREPAASTPALEPSPPAPMGPKNVVQEPRSGEARCNQGACILRADSGRFFKSDEFCIERADTGVARCIIHGRLVHPDATVKCNLSNVDNRLVAAARTRWRTCDEGL